MRIVFGRNRMEMRDARGPGSRNVSFRHLDFEGAKRLLVESIGAPEMSQLRHALHSSTSAALFDLDDHAVVEELSRKIASGTLGIVATAPKRARSGGGTRAAQPTRQPAPSPEPTPAVAPAPQPAPQREEPAPADAGLDAQAMSLRAAAETGAPFCEECARRAAAAQQQPVF